MSCRPILVRHYLQLPRTLRKHSVLICATNYKLWFEFNSLDPKNTCAGAHISVLYLWQITILRASVLQSPAMWLGLFVISDGSPMHDLIPQVCASSPLIVYFSCLLASQNSLSFFLSMLHLICLSSAHIPRDCEPLKRCHP